MNSLQPTLQQLVDEWETFSSVAMPIDHEQVPEQAKFEPPFTRESNADAIQRHSAAVSFLVGQGVSSQIIDDLRSTMESLTGSGAKLDGGRHIARTAIRAEALAYGFVDFDILSMQGTYLRATDYTE